MKFACFSPLYLKIFEKSPFLMKTPSQNFAHHTEVKKHPFGVKTPNLATLALSFLRFDLYLRAGSAENRIENTPIPIKLRRKFPGLQINYILIRKLSLSLQMKI